MHCTGNAGCFPRGKASSHSTALPSFCCCFLCAVFSCFRNPPNSDINYRIFNMRTFLCVRIHTGGGPHRQRVSTTFWLGKTFTNVCAPYGIRTSGHGIHWISRRTLYPLSHHVPRTRRREIRQKKRNRPNRSRLLRQAMVAEVQFFSFHWNPAGIQEDILI